MDAYLPMTKALHTYLLDISLREDPVLLELRQSAAALPLAKMQVAPDQAQFMQFLIKLIGATRVLELGTFRGYSALAMALALPEDGQLITCDINEDWTKDAAFFWKKANQSHKISLRLAPALETLDQLIAAGYEKKFDFIFIDADKTRYCDYYERALRLVSPKGLIAIDNIFWDGLIIDPNEIGAQTKEIRRLNQRIKEDARVDISLLSIADGLFLVKPR